MTMCCFVHQICGAAGVRQHAGDTPARFLLLARCLRASLRAARFSAAVRPAMRPRCGGDGLEGFMGFRGRRFFIGRRAGPVAMGGSAALGIGPRRSGEGLEHETGCGSKGCVTGRQASDQGRSTTRSPTRPPAAYARERERGGESERFLRPRVDACFVRSCRLAGVSVLLCISGE